MSAFETSQRTQSVDPSGDFLRAEHYRRQLETIAANATLALFIMDEQQQCTYMNPAAEQLTGYTLAEVQGKALHDVIHHTRPDGTPYPLEECPIDQAFPQNMREQGQEVFVHKDGHFYPVAFTASPIREAGRTVGTIIEVRDITEEKREQAEHLERSREPELAAAIGRALTHGGTLRETLQRSAEAVVEHLDASFARIWTLNEDEQVLELQASAGLYTHLDGPHGRVPVGAFKIGKIAEDQKPHLSNDVPRDPQVSDQDWAREEGMQAFAGYPLTVEGRTVGVLAMFTRARLAERTMGSLATVADGLAVAIDRHRSEQERERLLRELEVERGRLREVFMQAPALIAVLRGPEHVFELANPPYLTLLGNRDFMGKTIRQAVPEVEGQGYFEMLDEVYASGKTVVGNESRALLDRHGNGVLEEGFFNFVFQPLTNAEGTVDGILIHAVEVTTQVEARREVERLEERLRLALDAADVGTYDWDTTSSALSWDHRTRRIFGVPDQCEVSFGTFLQIVHPEHRDAASEAVQKALDPAGGGSFETEYRIVHPQSGQRWVRAVGRVYFEGQGAARHSVRFLGTVQDITERKQAEAERERLIGELEAGASRLEQIFTEAPAVMALYSGPEHIITVVNPTWEHTVGKPDAIGRPFREVFPEFAGTGLFEMLDQVYETGEAFVNSEVNVPLERWGSGVLEDTYWNLVWRPLAGGGEHGRDILVHAVEVTDQVLARQEVEKKADELVRLTRQLEASNRELDQFAYVASHDLKAPLRGIANLSSWIEEDLGDNATNEVREHLELLRGRAHRMEGLIDGILQYSRAGRVREDPEPLDVGALLHEVVDFLSPPADFQIRIGEVMPTLVTERLPLQQVFMNLIGNAIKYNRSPDPWVEVSVQDRGTWVEFAVADNGPGIAPEYHDRIFGIFQTLQARDEVEGTGIGLSLVRKLVDTRGGRIWVESAEGAGSTFRFTWPKESTDVAAD